MEPTNRIENAVRKDGDQITMNISVGQVSQLPNGDYYLVHRYDAEIIGLKTKNAKIRQLKTWVDTTFPTSAGLPTRSDEMVGAAARIFESASKDDLIKLVEWLADTRDN
jgi:hypothetical protein